MSELILEKHLVEEYLSALADEWYITREVKGKSTISGKPKRIDAVIKSKTYPQMIFGIEFKRYDLGSFAEFTHWFKQAIIYTQCHWIGRNDKTMKLPILIAPKPEYGTPEHTFIFTRLVGEFGIGDILKEWHPHISQYNYSIRFKETKVWSTLYGYNQAAIKQDFTKHLDL